MPMSTPKSDLCMVVTPAHLALGVGYLDQLCSYRNAEEDISFVHRLRERLAWLGVSMRKLFHAYCHRFLPADMPK